MQQAALETVSQLNDQYVWKLSVLATGGRLIAHIWLKRLNIRAHCRSLGSSQSNFHHRCNKNGFHESQRS